MTTRKTLAALGAATALTTAPITAGAQTSAGDAYRLGNTDPRIPVRMSGAFNLLALQDGEYLDWAAEGRSDALFEGSTALGFKFVRETFSKVNVARESGVAFGWASDADMQAMLDGTGANRTGSFVHLHTSLLGVQVPLRKHQRGRMDITSSFNTNADLYRFRGAKTAGMENSVGAGLRTSVSLGMGNDFIQFAIGATMQAYQDSKAGFVMPAGPYGWVGMRLKLDGGKHGSNCYSFQ